MRHKFKSDNIRKHDTQDGGDSSEHPKTYKEIYLKHISSKSLAENNYTDGKVIETLPANQTSRLFGINAGKLVKVIRTNGSVVVEQRIANKYRLIRKLGEGYYGKVYLATDINSGKSVAIKVEDTKKVAPFLHDEERVYRILEGEEGFPTVRWSGKDGIYNIMAIDNLGPSLEQYRRQGNVHIPYRENAQIIGTANFASDNKLRNIPQSRRDDMESIGFMLMYFLRGPLPWQDVRNSNKNKKAAKILSIRKSVTIDDLCKGYPQEFAIYLKTCQSLRFDEEPDYYHLRLLFSNLLQRQNLSSDYMFDWQVANGRCATTRT
ncbi:Casein kinase I-like HRR25 [Mizuhopecten yessoensis]|uniref:Casein kinase I-like HRR25 n=1 Tax=Mizuhopecten yessoensis TaxID=6573 RepID=A0A210PEA4_MIZYE|nr:Casein kinase I-like HRR25 [Mizuhopecten yessoensis]